jgi:hypothetical protein
MSCGAVGFFLGLTSTRSPLHVSLDYDIYRPIYVVSTFSSREQGSTTSSGGIPSIIPTS